MVGLMSAIRRRAVSIPAMFVAAVLLVLFAPLWLPICAIADTARGKFRFPFVRLGLFAVGWTWMEIAGVTIGGVLWVTGRRKNLAANYQLQTWWAANLLKVLRVTTGITITTEGIDSLKPGPVVMLCRHASLADSLVSAWVITTVAGMWPRYVLKHELINDPCLDMFGHRLPNHFVDRDAKDPAIELQQLSKLSSGMSDRDVTIIFPEGTRASPAKIASVLTKIGSSDPVRAERMSALQHVLPPRPAGSAALLAGAPGVDVVVAWHVGFDGMNNFSGILKAIERKPRPVRFHARRISRSEIPEGDGFTEWLDATWLQVDRDVAELMKVDAK
jgi:1-acyl-sn-glycerol-3-phosphate acyltransferase